MHENEITGIIVDASYKIHTTLEVIEVKSVDAVAPVHAKQLRTYLKLMDLKVRLLINFNVNLIKEGITRVVNNL
jgi:GxxExxY protein